MESFSKTIGGTRFKFEPQRLGNSEEWIYYIETKDRKFTMKLDKNLKWKIRTKVPFMLKEIEDQLSDSIDQRNA